MKKLVAVLVCDKDKRECELILRDCEEQIARMSDERLTVDRAPDGNAVIEAIDQEKLVDLLYYDFRPGQSVEELVSFRKKYRESMVMIITDVSVSPLEYLRPGVLPDSLIFRPIEVKRLRQTNVEFISSFFARFKQMRSDESFVLNTREEKLYIPYSHIYYFEARDKKLYVRTKGEEYAFYDTIDSLSKGLPEQFARCHRSYIVNKSKIVRVIPAENYIELSGQIGVPLSRSYKQSLMGKLV